MEKTDYIQRFLKDHHNKTRSQAQLCYQYKSVLMDDVCYKYADVNLLETYKGKLPKQLKTEMEQLEREDEQRAPILRAEIEHSLEELSELRKELHPVDFHSDLWAQLQGAFGDVREDVAFLFCKEDNIPETQKLRRLDGEEKSDYRITFDNLCESVTHQLSFYFASYLVLPYLILLLEQKKRAHDFEWQILILSAAGNILATDIPHNHGHKTDLVSKEVLESYLLSIERLKEMARDFLFQNLKHLKELDATYLQYLCSSFLAILGDRREAFELMAGNWEQCAVSCPICKYFDEEMEGEGLDHKKQLNKIEPVPAMIGQWDQRSYDDNYLWLSNVAHLLGAKDEWKLSYYYGTYTCPKCGSRGMLIDWMKNGQ